MPKICVRMRDLPARTIVAAVADAAQRWADADFPPRVRATAGVAARTGYSEPVVDYALDRLFIPLTAAALTETIEAEIGSLNALDGFVVQRGKGARHARGVGRVCVISSRTTIGVALLPAIFAVCAKCDVTVKDREDALIAAFFETLAQEDDAFGRGARAGAWAGESGAVDLTAFDAVVAFGKATTLATIRNACAPEARFIPYGNRASAGYITAAALASRDTTALARGAARDMLLYDSQGCLSLHVLFVENQDEATAGGFFEALAAAARDAAIEFPAGPNDSANLAAAAAQRDAAAFRAAQGSGAVLAGDDCSFVLTYDAPQDQAPAFAPRTLGVVPVSGPAEALQYLRRHGIELEAFALSDGRADVVRVALEAGAVRLAPFGELQRPPVSSDHGGRPRIADFIRWIDREI